MYIFTVLLLYVYILVYMLIFFSLTYVVSIVNYDAFV